MFHLTTCPTCHTRFTVPEAAMGKLVTCPHCQSPFLAGKSVPEGEPAMKVDPAVGPAYNMTMIGETGPAIHFNCPRCKKPLEAPAGEAGTKKPCPHCGQRLQVPAAPPVPAAAGQAPLDKNMLAEDGAHAPAPAADPALNKTMLTEKGPPIRFDCPRCKKPVEVPASEAGSKRPCPSCGQRLQVPAAPPAAAAQPGLDKTMLAGDGGHAHAHAPDPALNKTMLTETRPPIRFDCPRCKKPVEVPASEAGSKQPCPSCGQRLQVPAASTGQPSVPAPQQAPAMSHASPIAAGAPVAGPLPGGAVQSQPAPAWPMNLSRQTYTIAGIVAGFFLLLVLLLVLLPSQDRQANQNAKKELDDLEKKMAAYQQELTRLKDKERDEEKWKQIINEQKEQNRLFGQQIAQSVSNLSKQKTVLDDQYDKLADIQDEDLRRQTKARLDQQKSKLRKQEAEVETLKAAIEEKNRKAREDEQRLAMEKKDREEHNKMLQMQMIQHRQAMDLAAINASRPHYYPWHPFRLFPW
jgi:DNA-directed RNA polymerase subunit RPC12/RpoP